VEGAQGQRKGRLWVRRKQMSKYSILPFNSLAGLPKNDNGTGAVCDQKTSKFFVSSGEDSIIGHVDVNGVY
jgi:hypothetical protein